MKFAAPAGVRCDPSRVDARFGGLGAPGALRDPGLISGTPSGSLVKRLDAVEDTEQFQEYRGMVVDSLELAAPAGVWCDPSRVEDPGCDSRGRG